MDRWWLRTVYLALAAEGLRGKEMGKRMAEKTERDEGGVAALMWKVLGDFFTL